MNATDRRPASPVPVLMLADRMLGKLARLLRMLGHDVEYVREGDALQIAEKARADGRVLLTRDKRIAQKKHLGPLLFIRNNYPFHQTRQVIRDLDLRIDARFKRCVEDNGLLRRVAKDEVAGAVPAYVIEVTTEFFRCDRCERTYWMGTHVAAMQQMIAALEDAPLVTSDGGGSDPAAENALRTLEPLVDLHHAMDVLFLKHRLALMTGDLPSAVRIFRRFAMCMRRHVHDEADLVLPTYARPTPPDGYERGAAPEIFSNEHEKILQHLDQIGCALETMQKNHLDPESSKVECLHLIDRQKIFVDLVEHHDLRERKFLYPALERILTENEKLDLLERMVGLKMNEETL